MGAPSLLDHYEGRCRVCSQKQATIDLFGAISDRKNLIQCIKKYLYIEVLPSDELPKVICKKCCDLLVKFDRFAENASVSQKKLRELPDKMQQISCIILSDVEIQPKAKVEEENPEADELLSRIGEKNITEPGLYQGQDDFKVEDNHIDVSQEGPVTRERRKRRVVSSVALEELGSEIELDSEEEYLAVRLNKNATRAKKEENGKAEEYAGTTKIGEEELALLEDSSSDGSEYKGKRVKRRRTNKRISREEQEKELNEFYQLTCPPCNLKCTTFRSLLLHAKTVHNGRPAVFCHCGKSFYRRSHLIRHRHQHLGFHRFKCEICERGFHFKFMLRTHMYTHGPESEKPYHCDQCSRAYITKSGLTNHKLMKHLPPRARVTCEICQNTFSHPNCLYTHKKTVHGEQRHFVCHVCGKTMSTLGNLKGHLETHKESCNVQCEVCGKKFKTRMRLVRHMEYHRSTWHECSICGRTYQTRGALRSHLLVHSDQRPHKCNLCSKAFKRSKQLKLHLYQHTGERPYKCPHCPKTFTNAGNRATHKRRIHSKQIAMTATAQEEVEDFVGDPLEPAQSMIVGTSPIMHHSTTSSQVQQPPVSIINTQQQHSQLHPTPQHHQQQVMMGMMGGMMLSSQGLASSHNIPMIPVHVVPPHMVPAHQNAATVYSNMCQQLHS